jgi:hypothetical protein
MLARTIVAAAKLLDLPSVDIESDRAREVPGKC